jgi:hypothetical protein
MIKKILSIFRKPKSRAEQNEKTYRKWLNAHIPKATTTKIELERVFTDRSDNNWYVFKNIGTMTRERAIKIEEVLTWLDYGISKEEFSAGMREIEAQIKSMPWETPTKDKLRKFHDSALQKLGDFLYRVENVKIEDLMLQSVMYFVLIDGEDPYVLNSQLQAEKFAIAKSDPELRAFFLQIMQDIFIGWSNTKNNSSRG